MDFKLTIQGGPEGMSVDEDELDVILFLAEEGNKDALNFLASSSSILISLYHQAHDEFCDCGETLYEPDEDPYRTDGDRVRILQ